MSKWISVKDKLPEDYAKPNAKIVTVLICTKSNRVTIASRCYYKEFKGYNGRVYPAHYEWSKWKGGTVTHWQPLPKPPKECNL